MTSPALDRFIAEAAARSRVHSLAADRVLALAPLMLDLIEDAESFLEPQHYRSDPDGYTRNLIRDDPDHGLSLYALVWRPGQWTPVHDHGSWGVVGIVEGVLEERSYLRVSPEGGDQDIDLVRGGPPTAHARRGDEFRAEPRPHPCHGRSRRARPGRQPAPVWAHDEGLQHLRRRGTHAPPRAGRAQRELRPASVANQKNARR